MSTSTTWPLYRSHVGQTVTANRPSRTFGSAVQMQKITRTTANGVVPKKRPISIFVEVQTIITEAKYLLDISSAPSALPVPLSFRPTIPTPSLIFHAVRNTSCPETSPVCCDHHDSLIYHVDSTGLLRGPSFVFFDQRLSAVVTRADREVIMSTNVPAAGQCGALERQERTTILVKNLNHANRTDVEHVIAQQSLIYPNGTLVHMKLSKFFTFHGRDCLITVFGINETGKTSSELQISEYHPSGSISVLASWSMPGITAIDVLSTSTTVFLAVARNGVTGTTPRTSRIYRLKAMESVNQKIRFQRINTVSTRGASDVVLLPTHRNDSVLCVFASGKQSFGESASVFRYESQFDVFVESRSLPVYAAESLTKISHMGLNFLVVSSPYQQTVSVWQWVDHLEFTRLTEIRISARLVHPFWPDMKDRVMLAIVESHSLFVRIFDGDWDELHRQGLENLKNYHSLPTTFPYHRSQINTARSHEMGHMYTKNKTEQDSTYLENSPTVTIGFEKSPITNHSLNVSVRENTFPEHKTHPQKAARSDLAVQLNLGKTPLSSKQTKNNKVVQTSTAKSHVPFMSTNHIQRRNPKILSPRYQSRATKTRITTRLASNEEKDEQARETWGESAEASPEDDDEFVLTDFPPAPAETGSEAVSTMKEALDVHQRTPVKIDWWFNRDEVAIGNYLMEHDKNIIRVPLDEDKFRRKEKTKQLSNEEKPITNYVDVDEKLYKVRRERYISTQV